MTPTREQVLEWQKDAAEAVMRKGLFESHEQWLQWLEHTCALAYAAGRKDAAEVAIAMAYEAGKAEGAREENEACEKLCLTPFPESGTPHSLAFDSPEECADAIRKRRPA